MHGKIKGSLCYSFFIKKKRKIKKAYKKQKEKKKYIL